MHMYAVLRFFDLKRYAMRDCMYNFPLIFFVFTIETEPSSTKVLDINVISEKWLSRKLDRCFELL